MRKSLKGVATMGTLVLMMATALPSSAIVNEEKTAPTAIEAASGSTAEPTVSQVGLLILVVDVGTIPKQTPSADLAQATQLDLGDRKLLTVLGEGKKLCCTVHAKQRCEILATSPCDEGESLQWTCDNGYPVHKCVVSPQRGAEPQTAGER